MKKLFIFLFYASVIAFAAFVFILHKDIYQTLMQTKFTDGESIKIFAAGIISIIPDIVLYLMVLFSFLSFLFHLKNSAKTSKRLIKSAQRVGCYFVSLQIWSFVSSILLLVGTEGMMEAIKGTVTDPKFYMPIGIMVAATIVLVIARFITRGGPISGILVTIGLGILVFNNFAYYLDDMINSTYTTVFILGIVSCALACIPGFIPEPRN